MVNYESYKKSLAKFGTINLSNLIKEHFPSNGHKNLSCIITNPFVTWVADVAINHGIPCAMFWIQPCSLYAIYYRFYNKLNSFPTLTDPDMSVEFCQACHCCIQKIYLPLFFLQFHLVACLKCSQRCSRT
ncbi:hypothetical protein NC651_022527 [Populus alba x Populus x berolinensis]|nr:hypothetical protein NC651_022527 [Populus alba x Populus x berolinensis]